MICPKCGKELPDTVFFCTGCSFMVRKPAISVDNMPNSEQPSNRPVYNVPKFQLIQPEPLNETQINEINEKNRKTGKLIAFLCVCFVIAACVAGGVFISEMDKKTDNEIATMTQTYSTIQQGFSVDQTQAEKINNVFSMCGISNPSSIQHDDSLDDLNKPGEKGYRIKADGISNIIVYLSEKNEVSCIRYADVDLYSDGTVAYKLSDFYVTAEEEVYYKTQTENIVENSLISPKSADFPLLEWSFSKENGVITVSSYVDAVNAFNAEIRSYFTVTFDVNTKKATSFIFDGQKIF